MQFDRTWCSIDWRRGCVRLIESAYPEYLNAEPDGISHHHTDCEVNSDANADRNAPPAAIPLPEQPRLLRLCGTGPLDLSDLSAAYARRDQRMQHRRRLWTLQRVRSRERLPGNALPTGVHVGC